MKTENFPPRVYKHVETWVIRYDENKQNKFRGAIVTEFLSLEEHESIVEKLNKQIELLEGTLKVVDCYWFDPTNEEGACAICDCNLHENVMGKHGQINGDPCAFDIAHKALEKLKEMRGEKLK